MASSITFTHKSPRGGDRVGVISAAVTAHTDGPVTAVNLPHFSGKLLGMSTNPGSTAPTASYDMEFIDSASIDRLCGAGLNRHTSNTEYAAAVFTGTSVNPVVHPEEDLVQLLQWSYGDDTTAAIIHPRLMNSIM